jgi:two-component system chemotaxis sensor kinase CheA
MSISRTIQELARIAAEAGGDDVPRLVALREALLMVARHESIGGDERVVGVAADACGLVEAVILRELDDVDGAMARVQEAIDALRAHADALPADAALEPGELLERSGRAARERRADARVDLGVEADDTLLEFLGEAREHFRAAETAALELRGSPNDAELIDTIFRAFHTVKGVACFLDLEPIVEVSHSAESLLDAARSGRIRLGPSGIDLILRVNDVLGALVAALGGGRAPRRHEVDELIVLLEQARRGEHDGDAPAADEPSGPEGAERGVRAAPRADRTVRVRAERLDRLLDLVGELADARERVARDPSARGPAAEGAGAGLEELGRITRELQGVATSLRMVPVRGIFQRMDRLVCDAATRTGKAIDLRMQGEAMELDGGVVDMIADPLVHMVRNACDHGIEPGDERRAAGKPVVGTITLRAFEERGSVIVEVEDDGRGLDRDAIVRKAIALGIHHPGRGPSQVPDPEIFRLILRPGLTTAEAVTDISGRGVGMDVVRRNLETLRGDIEIRSTPGRGSTFTMRIPPTGATIPDRAGGGAR